MKSFFDILCFGSVTMDMFMTPDPQETPLLEKNGRDGFFIPLDEKIKASNVLQSCGGSAANTSAGFSKLGFHTAPIGFVGDDEARIYIFHELERLGIRTDYLYPSSHSFSSFSIIINAKDGRRTVLHYRNSQEDFNPEHLLGAPQTKAIYIGHLYGKSEDMLEAVPQWKKQTKGFIAWNPGKTQFQRGITPLKNVFPCVDILFLNVEEAEYFTGLKATKLQYKSASEKIIGETISISNKYVADTVNDIREMAKTFLDLGVRQIVFTDGKRGAQSMTTKEHFFVPSLDVRIQSTLGAGDAFAVGVTAAFIKGHPLPTQLLWGSRNAGSVIQNLGAQTGQLSLKKIQQDR